MPFSGLLLGWYCGQDYLSKLTHMWQASDQELGSTSRWLSIVENYNTNECRKQMHISPSPSSETEPCSSPTSIFPQGLLEVSYSSSCLVSKKRGAWFLTHATHHSEVCRRFFFREGDWESGSPREFFSGVSYFNLCVSDLLDFWLSLRGKENWASEELWEERITLSENINKPYDSLQDQRGRSHSSENPWR
jgi:hypothetical protein